MYSLTLRGQIAWIILSLYSASTKYLSISKAALELHWRLQSTDATSGQENEFLINHWLTGDSTSRYLSPMPLMRLGSTPNIGIAV
jgi:hypothetical protein